MTNGSANTVLEIKTQCVGGRDFDLRVVSSRLEFPFAREQRVVDLRRLFDSRTIQRLGQAMQFDVERVEKDNTEIAEDPGIKARECAGKILALAVAGSQDPGRFRRAKEGFDLLNRSRDLVAENDPSDRGILFMSDIHGEFLEVVSSCEVDEVYFLEIVIFACQPEQGHGPCLLGKLGHADGLEEAEQRTAEEADLLPGYDHGGALSQSLDVV